MYDDAGGWYDHIVPPFEGVPNDEAPCNLEQHSRAKNASFCDASLLQTTQTDHFTKTGSGQKLKKAGAFFATACSGCTIGHCSPPFDFKRLGLRSSAMLISPWVGKGYVR
jgi:hypothetical protein